MAKVSSKRHEAQVKSLTAKVEKLRGRLTKAEAATAKWKTEARRLEAEAAKWAKQLKKLKKVRKVETRPVAVPDVPDVPGAPQVTDVPEAPQAPEVPEAPDVPTTSDLPDQSWTVTRLRASARDAGVPGYSRMSKAALLDALSQRR